MKMLAILFDAASQSDVNDYLSCDYPRLYDVDEILSGLFSQTSDEELSAKHKELLRGAFKSALVYDMKARCDFDHVIKSFERVRLERKLQSIPSECSKGVMDAHTLGWNLRLELRQLMKSPINTWIELIESSIEKLADDPQTIAEFIEVLGIKVFEDLTSKEAISHPLNILRMYSSTLKELDDTAKVIDEAAKVNRHELSQWRKPIQSHLNDQHFAFSVDNVVLLNHQSQKTLENVTKTLVTQGLFSGEKNANRPDGAVTISAPIKPQLNLNQN